VRLAFTSGELSLAGMRASALAADFGTPLYCYDEQTLRQRCRSLKSLVSLENFQVYYSAKANGSVALLKIIQSEGLLADAMSPGELLAATEAGYDPKDLLFVSNNVSTEIFGEIAQAGVVKCCVDSLGQLSRWLKARPGGRAVLRINPAQGAGHHQKVVTAGKVKFGIDPALIPEAITQAQALGGEVKGLMVHIGSLFLDPEPWLKAVDWLLAIAEQYPQIDYIDFGGGMGIPYDRSQEAEFPVAVFGQALEARLTAWMDKTGRRPTFAIEPGRFVVAESGVCLIQVQSVKINQGTSFTGTNLGFNFLIRPEMYGAYHEILAATKAGEGSSTNVVGNICESGDYLGKDRNLPALEEGDLLVVRDTGAYGFSMASNYTGMGRPAEVLIGLDGQARLIRRRESPEQLLQNQIY